MTLESAAAAGIPAIPIDRPHANAIGHYVSYFRETAGRLTLDQAVAAYAGGDFTASTHRVLSFGIGARPVWIHFRVDNPAIGTQSRRLAIETAWLDRVDIYCRHGDATTATYHLGDTLPFGHRPVDSRYFVVDHAFPPGLSDIFIRVQTPDPMVVPIYLMTEGAAQERAKEQDYSYGFLYGFLFALLVYNVMLYAGLRDTRYILYSLYLGMFLTMNISYTGHGFKWLWPDHTTWEQWSNPVLMVLYGASGLLFALGFLDVRRHFPRTHRSVVGYVAVTGLLLLLAMVFDSQRYALLVAFTFVFTFTAIMLTLGVLSMRSGQKPARYFLLAAISAMLGAAITALAVWGFIPFNNWTFRAVDIGMLLDATLLALALTYQFRVGQADKLRAEQLAKLDPLTGLNNRRAFYDKTLPIWNITLRHGHSLSVVLLDLDCFKRINDAYGHSFGDEVLVETAKVLTQSIREQDVMARWGGEEFIVLLPETDLREAITLAERLRSAIADLRLRYNGNDVTVTASFGVAQRGPGDHSVDTVISGADKQMYRSKDLGRNRISYA